MEFLKQERETRLKVRGSTLLPYTPEYLDGYLGSPRTWYSVHYATYPRKSESGGGLAEPKSPEPTDAWRPNKTDQKASQLRLLVFNTGVGRTLSTGP